MDSLTRTVTMEDMKRLILASKSPRRKELLERCGLPFEAVPADLNEVIDCGLALTDAIQKLALQKATAVLKQYPDAIVIGSDTIVVQNGECLGKPKNREDAKRMLRELSGNMHEVITGLAFVSDKKTHTDVSVSKVTFQVLTEEEIERYVESGEADDKAGAYGIQGQAGLWIQHIEGDYYSIMGLPLNLVYNELKHLKEYE